MYDGPGTLSFTNGYRYTGEFRRGTYSGRFTVRYPDGATYVGEFKEGKRHGPGEEYAANGSLLRKGNWEDNVYVGKGSAR